MAASIPCKPTSNRRGTLNWSTTCEWCGIFKILLPLRHTKLRHV